MSQILIPGWGENKYPEGFRKICLFWKNRDLMEYYEFEETALFAPTSLDGTINYEKVYWGNPSQKTSDFDLQIDILSIFAPDEIKDGTYSLEDTSYIEGFAPETITVWQESEQREQKRMGEAYGDLKDYLGDDYINYMD